MRDLSTLASAKRESDRIVPQNWVEIYSSPKFIKILTGIYEFHNFLLKITILYDHYKFNFCSCGRSIKQEKLLPKFETQSVENAKEWIRVEGPS